MSQPFRPGLRSLSERIRARFGDRAVAVILTLFIEGLLGLALLTIGPSIVRREEAPMSVFSFDATRVSDELPAPAEAEPEPATTAERIPEPELRSPDPADLPADIPLAPSRPPDLDLSRDQMARLDIGAMPSARRSEAPQGPAMGPVDTSPADTPRVAGTGPNGEPLYAAAWYREPYDDELSGYLSTARGPGWGLIACRTVADFRVEDCVAVDEYPAGSNITRSILAAAWQFRVRPPRVGGRFRVGEWVRIRIDYDLQPR